MKLLGVLAVLVLGLANAQTLPEFKLEDTSGNVVTLATLKGKPALVVFWATWCGVCASELPQLRELATKDKLDVYLLSVSDSPGEVRSFLAEYKLSMFKPLFRHAGGDNCTAVAERWHVVGQPVSF
ncbi:MAG: TlpA family protein disulfide reductase, partial [Meiothermus sp.]